MNLGSLSEFNRFFNKARDIVIADLAHCTPNAVKWLYRTKFKPQIFSTSIDEKTSEGTKTAFLYLHGDLESQLSKETSAILLLHGIYGHPLSLLPLADIAQNAALGPVFSLYLPYDEYNPEVHRSLLKQAIDEIERMIGNNGSEMKALVTAGHSLGAIESAYRAFVEKDDRIKAVISIAGRLRVIPSLERACDEHLRPTVEIVYQGIQESPHLPLYQIVSGDDWNAPLEATLVRPNEGYYHIVPNAMHLNVLYHKETHQKFEEFLKKSLF